MPAKLPSFFADREWDYRIALCAVTLVTVGVLGVPLLVMVLASLRGPAEFLPMESGARWTVGNFQYVFGDRSLYTDIIPQTLIFAGGSVALSATIALALAWHVERAKLARPVLIRMLILAPMALPTPALAVAWISLLGPNAGWINQMARPMLGLQADTGPFNVFSMEGLIWCQGIAGVPFAYLLLAPAVRAVSRSMEESAYTGGATPGRAFWRIGMPTMLPSLVGPLLILLLVGLEQVDFPYILGPTAGINVLGTRMLWEIASPTGLPNFGGTAALAILILVFAIISLVVCHRLGLESRRSSGLAGHGLGRTWSPRWVVWLLRALIAAYTVFALILPLGVLLISSFGIVSDGSARKIAQCCFQGYTEITDDPRFWKAAINTMIVAVCSAAIATLVGMWIAMCSTDVRSLMGGFLDRISISSVGIPSLLVAFGAAVATLSVPVGLYGTIGLLVIAYSYRIAVSTRLIKAGLSQVGVSLYEAAGASGARWIRVQTRIVLPLIAPSVIASAAILFVVGMKEFTIPLMLHSPENVVLPVLLLQFQQAGNPAAAAAVGIVLFVLTVLGVATLMLADHWLARRRGER